MVDDSEWLKDWRERSKGALLSYPPERQYGSYNKMQGAEWDRIRSAYRAEFGDRQLSEVPIVVDKYRPKKTRRRRRR